MRYFLLFLCLLFHLFLLNNLIFTAWPEMLSYPYLFSNNFMLYRDFIMPYPPILIWILTVLFQLFNFQPEALKLFTLLIVIINDILIYKIINKIVKKNFQSIYFLMIYIFLQSFLEGNMMWFDFATVTPLLGAIFFLFNWLETGKKQYIFLVSLCLTVALFIKQIALIYFLAFLIPTIFLYKHEKIYQYFLVGFLIVFIPIIIYLWHNNLFINFWLWTIWYPLTEWSKFPGYVNFAISPKYFLVSLLLLLPLIGVFLNLKMIKEKIFLYLISFTIAALIAVYPRFSFFHLQPAIAILVIVYSFIWSKINFSKKIYLLLLTMSCVMGIIIILFKNMIGNEMRFYDQTEKQLIQQICQITADKQTVYLLGLNSSIYAYCQKLPPKNWGDNFGWYLEIPGVTEWVLQGFKRNPPEIIFRKIPALGSWYALATYQPFQIVQFIENNYQKSSTIDKSIEIWIKK